jgi:talin
VSKAGTEDASRLAPLGAELSRQYTQLAADAGGAASATSNPDVAQRLTGGVHELGQACVELVRAGGACHMGPTGDSFAQREVADAGRTVSEKVQKFNFFIVTSYLLLYILSKNYIHWFFLHIKKIAYWPCVDFCQVSQVLAALQAGSRGTQACINAASTVSGIIGDLDTTIMFATAGTLHAEGEGESFSDHREHILKTAKALVEDTKTLVAGLS